VLQESNKNYIYKSLRKLMPYIVYVFDHMYFTVISDKVTSNKKKKIYHDSYCLL